MQEHNLSPEFLAEIEAELAGTKLGSQELQSHVLTEVEPTIIEEAQRPMFHIAGIPTEVQAHVLFSVMCERSAQDAKFGAQRKQTNERWLAILNEETGEAAKEILDGRNRELYQELIQVAAVAVCWAEALRLNGVD